MTERTKSCGDLIASRGRYEWSKIIHILCHQVVRMPRFRTLQQPTDHETAGFPFTRVGCTPPEFGSVEMRFRASVAFTAGILPPVKLLSSVGAIRFARASPDG